MSPPDPASLAAGALSTPTRPADAAPPAGPRMARFGNLREAGLLLIITVLCIAMSFAGLPFTAFASLVASSAA